MGQFGLDVRKKFSTMRLMQHGDRLPREAVGVPSLEKFRIMLGRALSSPI